MTRAGNHQRPLASLRRLRRGFTLIEVAVVVTITSLLFALSATTIVALLRVERQCAMDAASAQSLSRLVARWRADVHAATAANCEQGCALARDDGRTVHYEFESPAVQREVRRGDTIEHRDAFLLAADSETTFSSKIAGEKSLVIMKVASPSEKLSQSRSRNSVEAIAVVNLHGTNARRPTP